MDIQEKTGFEALKQILKKKAVLYHHFSPP